MFQSRTLVRNLLLVILIVGKHAWKQLTTLFDFDCQSAQLVHTVLGVSSDVVVNELASVIMSMVNARVQLAGLGYIVRKVNNNKFWFYSCTLCANQTIDYSIKRPTRNPVLISVTLQRYNAFRCSFLIHILLMHLHPHSQPHPYSNPHHRSHPHPHPHRYCNNFQYFIFNVIRFQNASRSSTAPTVARHAAVNIARHVTNSPGNVTVFQVSMEIDVNRVSWHLPIYQ